MNTKIKKNSLLFKTMSTLIFFSILILLSLYLCQIIFTNYYYEKHKIKQVNSISNNLEKNINNLDSFLGKISLENDVCIQYLDGSINKIYNGNIKGCLLLEPNNKMIALMDKMHNSNKQTIFYKITNPLYNTKTFLYGKHLSNGGYVFINSQLESLDNTSRVMSSQLVYLLIIIIIIAILLAVIVSDMITKPIIEITKKAKRLGSGDLNVVFENSNISEINELSETLNYTKNEMIKTDDYRRDLMANVGHDLKTPLTLIKSYAEMVRDISYKNEEKRVEHLNVIIKESDRLNNLVNDIITLSKLEANADQLDVEEYDLILEIMEIIEKFKILEITENYNFIFTGPESAFVKADKNKINQVLYNLINNAVNYTGKDMNVYINLTKVKNGYQVEIIDTGKGIDKETIRHIWDRYYKTEKKHKRNKVGTGLGLAIVKEILDKHNFKYGVKSKVGKGTNFYFIVNL